MTIQISQDWYSNNISGQEGYTLDSENGVYTKTIPEADLNFEFSTDGEHCLMVKHYLNETKSFLLIVIFRYYSQSHFTSFKHWIFN